MRRVSLDREAAEKGVCFVKFKINKDYCEPDKIKVMDMLNHYFEPSFILTPLDFFPMAIILMKTTIDRYRVMAPPPT